MQVTDLAHLALWLVTVLGSPDALVVGSLVGEFLTTYQELIAPFSDFLVKIFGVPDRLNAAVSTPSDILRVLIAIPVFIYASYCDIKERIVRNHVWIPVFVGGLVLLLFDFLTASDIMFLAPWMLGNLFFATIVGWLLYKTHLFGGADMKALIGLALLFPTYPALIVFPRVLPPTLPAPHNAINMFVLTILANTALVAVIYPLYTLAANIREGFDITRPGLMLTARRVPLEQALNEHGKILPIWVFNGGGLISRGIMLIKTVMLGIDTKFVKEYLEWHNDATEDNLSDPSDLDNIYIDRFLNSQSNKDDSGEQIWETDKSEQAQEAMEALIAQEKVWMTPGIPFIVPMTLGLFVSLTFGDIVYWVVVALN